MSAECSGDSLCMRGLYISESTIILKNVYFLKLTAA
jgi:hypothetical protein